MLIPGGSSESGPAQRFVRRAEPRLLITIAAAGAIVAATGPLLIGGDEVFEPGGSQLPGIALTALAVAAGYFLLARFRDSPLATAGSIAVVVAVPSLMYFLTYQEMTSGLSGSTEGILFVSAAVYGATWAAGPARGRPVFAGMGLVFAWLFVIQVAEDAVDFLPTYFFSVQVVSPGQVPSFAVFDETTVGVLSLLIGGGYLVLARLWDLRGFVGAATPATVAGLIALSVAVVMLSADLEGAGTGVLLMMIGLPIGLHGANTGRRATTWLGGLALALGVFFLVADATDDFTIAGVVFIGIGIGVVTLAHQLRATLPETDEVAAPADRLRQRPGPRFLLTLAAVGGLIVAVGVGAIGFDAVFPDGSGDGSQIPGVILAVGLAGAGYALLWQVGQGVPATAGSVGAVAAIPMVMFFVTFDIGARTYFSIEGVLAVSAMVWLGTWFWTKRPVFLGAGLLAAWLLLLEVVEAPLGFVVSGDFLDVMFTFFGEVPDVDIPDGTTIGLLSLLAAGIYAALAVRFDRAGDLGAGTPVVPSLVAAVVAAAVFLADDLEQSGTGLYFAAVGVGLALLGSRSGRRFTTWAGGAGVVVGVQMVIMDLTDSATASGLLAIVVGGGIVACAHVLGESMSEPGEMAQPADAVLGAADRDWAPTD